MQTTSPVRVDVSFAQEPHVLAPQQTPLFGRTTSAMAALEPDSFTPHFAHRTNMTHPLVITKQRFSGETDYSLTEDGDSTVAVLDEAPFADTEQFALDDTMQATVEYGGTGECPFGPAYQKYWDKLPQISRYFEELLFDKESLLSIKPIRYFHHLGLDLPRGIGTIVEPFAGGGGAGIGFALAGKKVAASDLDPQKVMMAKHNARVYRVTDQIRHTQGDARHIVQNSNADAIYLDPPWGGFERKRDELFGLKHLGDFGREMLETSLDRFRHVIFSVPRDIDLNELKQFGRDFTVYNGKIKGKSEFTTIHFFPEHD